MSGGSDWSGVSSGSSCSAGSVWDWERKEPLAILQETDTDRRSSAVSDCLSESSGEHQHHHLLQLPQDGVIERRLSSQSVSSDYTSER